MCQSLRGFTLAMIDCPRCGFSQPKDQFCANCGINMEAYQPAPKPVTQKLASNLYVIGTLITVVVASVVWYLMSQSPDSPGLAENTITRDEAFEQQHQEELAKEVQERQQRMAEKEQQRRLQQQQQDLQAAAISKLKSQNPQAGVAGTETKDQSSNGAKPAKQLQLQFYEIPAPLLDQIFTKGQVTAESPHSRSIVIKDNKELQTLLQGAKPLGSAKNWNATPGEVLTASYSNIGDDLKPYNYEMNLEVVINRSTGEGVNYQFRGDLFLAEADNNPPPMEIPPETHQVPVKGSVVVVGLLPHEGVPETASEHLQAPLSVMTSPEFKTNETEFIMVFSPR